MRTKTTIRLALAAAFVCVAAGAARAHGPAGWGHHGGGYYHGGYRHGGGTTFRFYYGGWGWPGVYVGPSSFWWGYPFRYGYYPYAYPYYPPPAPQYWYYCGEPRGYYPYVTQCPSGWVPVPAQPGPPGS